MSRSGRKIIRGGEAAHLGAIIQDLLRRTSSALDAHHVLLEELRTDGTLNDEQAARAVRCLQLYNALAKE